MSMAIVTTHLKYSPKNDFYRCIQLEYLLNEIKQLKLEGKISDVPIILCGDFNSLINSQPIQLILNQSPPHSSVEVVNYKENSTFRSASDLACSIRTKSSQVSDKTCELFLKF